MKHLVHGLLEGVLLAGSLTDGFKLFQVLFKVHLNIFAECGVLQNDKPRKSGKSITKHSQEDCWDTADYY